MLHGIFPGHDRAFLAEMALRGRMVQLEEPLQMIREHAERFTQARHRPEDRLAWHDASRAGEISLPAWRLYAEYFRMVGRHLDDPAERLRCRLQLARWPFHNWNWGRLGVDLLATVAPGALHRAEALKQRFLEPAPKDVREEESATEGE